MNTNDASLPVHGQESPLGTSDPDALRALEARLGYSFLDRSWLERALTHRSAPSFGTRKDYERLEFLGDAVLDLAVAHLLSDTYGDAPEGDLSKMRATLVNTNSLADLARTIQLGPVIRMGRGEAANGGSDRASILADVFEALVGAIYRDSGYAPAFECVRRLFGERISSVVPRDPKTELQEILHALGQEAPTYLLECVEGPEHAPVFVSVVQIRGENRGRGRGTTKKASQQAAAAEAIEFLKRSPQGGTSSVGS